MSEHMLGMSVSQHSIIEPRVISFSLYELEKQQVLISNKVGRIQILLQ